MVALRSDPTRKIKMRGKIKPQIDINEINTKIQLLKKTAEELNRMGEDFPALARNTARILASVKMLEINVSDLVDLQSRYFFFGFLTFFYSLE